MFTVVPAGAVGTWVMSARVQALLLRLSPALLREAAEAMGLPVRRGELVPTINVRDPHIERLGALVRAERDDGYPSGRLYLDSLASALAARLLARQASGGLLATRRGLPGRRLRDVLTYIDEHLDEDLGLDELAAVAGSARRTSRCCSRSRPARRCTATSSSGASSALARCCWRAGTP
jgi:AraC family transcriptional regulator